MFTTLFRVLSRHRSPVNAVLVLGMHRSGTSSLAGSLDARQGMPLEQGVALWCAYNLRLLDLYGRLQALHRAQTPAA